jgi:hypothetical protein
MIRVLIPAILKEKRLFPVHKESISSVPVARGYARERSAATFFRKPVDGQALPDAVWWAISITRQATSFMRKSLLT